MITKIKKTTDFVMLFIMVFLLLNTVFVTTAKAEEIPENTVVETSTATATDASKEETIIIITYIKRLGIRYTITGVTLVTGIVLYFADIGRYEVPFFGKLVI